MAVCIYDDAFRLRVPAGVAADSLPQGRAVAFQPYGRAPMQEWIQIGAGADALTQAADLLAAAIALATATDSIRTRREQSARLRLRAVERDIVLREMGRAPLCVP